MEKDKDIIEVIIDEQPTNNKKIKFAYWDNLAKDLSPLFIKISSAVCIMIVLGVFFVGFFIFFYPIVCFCQHRVLYCKKTRRRGSGTSAAAQQREEA